MLLRELIGAVESDEPSAETVEVVAIAIADAWTSHFGTPWAEQNQMMRACRRAEARAAIAAYCKAIRERV